METLHLRADENTIEKIISVINQFSSQGDSVEIVDNLTYNFEQKLILNGLAQEEANDVFEHEDVWAELLND